jgi:hypothetical protein
MEELDRGTVMNTDTSTPAADPTRNGTRPPAAERPVMPPPELFEFEPEGIGPLSDELKASLADSAWIEDELWEGRLLEYSGKHIAVIDRKVVGVGSSPLALADEIAEKLGVPPCRVAVSYVG